MVRQLSWPRERWNPCISLPCIRRVDDYGLVDLSQLKMVLYQPSWVDLNLGNQWREVTGDLVPETCVLRADWRGGQVRWPGCGKDGVRSWSAGWEFVCAQRAWAGRQRQDGRSQASYWQRKKSQIQKWEGGRNPAVWLVIGGISGNSWCICLSISR